ncbi:hypothetical protein CARUB_v10024524mg, partial [Capsella rubella]
MDVAHGYLLNKLSLLFSDNLPNALQYTRDACKRVSREAFQEALNLVGQSTTSPRDQFEIVPLIPINIRNFYFSFTNSSLFMLLTLRRGNLVPNAWQFLVEFLYDFVLNLVKDQIGGLSG